MSEMRAELLDGEEWKGGGYTQSNHKKMYKCPCCGKRFVYDHGQLSFYSHSREDVWDELLKDTVIPDCNTYFSDEISSG